MNQCAQYLRAPNIIHSELQITMSVVLTQGFLVLESDQFFVQDPADKLANGGRASEMTLCCNSKQRLGNRTANKTQYQHVLCFLLYFISQAFSLYHSPTFSSCSSFFFPDSYFLSAIIYLLLAFFHKHHGSPRLTNPSRNTLRRSQHSHVSRLIRCRFYLSLERVESLTLSGDYWG
jgi:hypothetical protein